jgi:hypothetical protein
MRLIVALLLLLGLVALSHGKSRNQLSTSAVTQMPPGASECQKCQFSCSMLGKNKNSLCRKRCNVIACSEKPTEKSGEAVEAMSEEDFNQLAYAAAVELFDELSDSNVAKFAVNNRCQRCKKPCKNQGYKCFATCANKSFCQYEDNTIPVTL